MKLCSSNLTFLCTSFIKIFAKQYIEDTGLKYFFVKQKAFLDICPIKINYSVIFL